MHTFANVFSLRMYRVIYIDIYTHKKGKKVGTDVQKKDDAQTSVPCTRGLKSNFFFPYYPSLLNNEALKIATL